MPVSGSAPHAQLDPERTKRADLGKEVQAEASGEAEPGLRYQPSKVGLST
jgi:hypothetical protein